MMHKILTLSAVLVHFVKIVLLTAAACPSDVPHRRLKGKVPLDCGQPQTAELWLA